MASNFVGPDVHDSEIVRRYQQMVPTLKDKLEKAIRLYGNMVRQHAECHEGDVFRLDTGEYSRQMADVVRQLDEMHLLLSTMASWGSLPVECLYGAEMDASRLDMARQPDFNALEAEGRAQLDRMLSVQAVLQRCRPSRRRGEAVEEEEEGMETDEGPQATATPTGTSVGEEEEEEEEEERHGSLLTDELALSPPAVVAAAGGTPVNPASVPVHSMQTPPPPPPPRPSTTSGRVSTPQHLHPVQTPKEELRSGPPSSEGGASDGLKHEEGSAADSPAPFSAALMRAGSHSNSPAETAAPNELAGASILQATLAGAQRPLVTPKTEPVVKTEVLEGEETGVN